MGGYDLHTHSTWSDGTESVASNVRRALELGLEGLGVTDHDTTAGIDEGLAAAEGSRLEIVPGLEFSAEHEGASLHVLAYWVDPGNASLRAELRRLTDTRVRRGELMIEKLQQAGYDISFDRVRRIAGEDLIARPHVAQAMVEAGIVAGEREAFDRFIGDGGPAYVPKHALDPLVALDLIADAAGVCVLAHPGMWRGTDSVPVEVIERMAAGGMAGLEVDHPDHDDGMRTRYRDLARGLGLIATGASDCHGARFGFRLGSETTDAQRVDALRERRPAARPAAGPA